MKSFKDGESTPTESVEANMQCMPTVEFYESMVDSNADVCGGSMWGESVQY